MCIRKLRRRFSRQCRRIPMTAIHRLQSSRLFSGDLPWTCLRSALSRLPWHRTSFRVIPPLNSAGQLAKPGSPLLKMRDIIILSCLRTKQVGCSQIATPDGCCLDCGLRNRHFGQGSSLGKWTAVQLLPDHRQLLGQRFWQLRGLKGMIDPHPQVTVDEQLLPQQRHQIGK